MTQENCNLLNKRRKNLLTRSDLALNNILRHSKIQKLEGREPLIVVVRQMGE